MMKDDERKAHLDGMYLKCAKQTEVLKTILAEMDEVLGYLYQDYSSDNPRPETKDAIKKILEQKAHGEILLDMSQQAEDFIGSAIKEDA